MFKSLKEKVLNSITAHPKLVTFGIGLAITFVIGTAIGMLEHHNLADALAASHGNSGGNGNHN
jgi:hypothetical protein